MDAAIDDAVQALRRGDPVLVYDGDGREGEVDLVYAAQHVTPDKVARLRNDAGGLVCTAISHDAAEGLGLPFYRDAVAHPAVEEGERAYGDRSSFSLWLNHKDVYTGITDTDRARTITALADATAAVAGEDDYDLATHFVTPGHVAVLRGADGGLSARRGHTELALALVAAADLAPAAVVCEMLDEAGAALPAADARAYAEEHSYPYLTGAEIVDATAEPEK